MYNGLSREYPRIYWNKNDNFICCLIQHIKIDNLAMYCPSAIHWRRTVFSIYSTKFFHHIYNHGLHIRFSNGQEVRTCYVQQIKSYGMKQTKPYKTKQEAIKQKFKRCTLNKKVEPKTNKSHVTTTYDKRKNELNVTFASTRRKVIGSSMISRPSSNFK